jgi:hypothetical protein
MKDKKDFNSTNGSKGKTQELIQKKIPVEARFLAPVQTGPGVYPASCTIGTGSFPGVKRPGRVVGHPPHLAPRLKKEYGYTSTPPFCCHDRL